MKTKQHLIIDRLIAKPLAVCLNFLIRLIGKFRKTDHSLDVPFNRIVVCKFKGLGSIIQATPMLQSIRQTYPEAEITFLSSSSNIQFLAEIDIIDQVMAVDDSSPLKLLKSLTSVLIHLINNKPEIFIDLEIYSHFSSLVTISTLAKNRIGFYLRSNTYRSGIYSHLVYYNTDVPISEVYMQIARLLNNTTSTPGLYPIYKNLSKINDHDLSNYIIINPNASDLRIERRWDGNNYRNLAIWLCNEYPDKTVIFIGASEDKPYVNELLSGLELSNLKNLAGKTSIKELIYLIRNAELAITNDTGPMHIAFACETPTIALFGPCSPAHYGRNSKAKIIYKRVYCSPCVHEFITPPCKGNNSCMQIISLEEVTNEIQQFYNNGQQFIETDKPQEKLYFFNNNEILGLVKKG